MQTILTIEFDYSTLRLLLGYSTLDEIRHTTHTHQFFKEQLRREGTIEDKVSVCFITTQPADRNSLIAHSFTNLFFPSCRSFLSFSIQCLQAPPNLRKTKTFEVSSHYNRLPTSNISTFHRTL